AERYTLSLHDALPILRLIATAGQTIRKKYSHEQARMWTISARLSIFHSWQQKTMERKNGRMPRRLSRNCKCWGNGRLEARNSARSEEHTSELQSRENL